MSASLVGSEMCIRDRPPTVLHVCVERQLMQSGAVLERALGCWDMDRCWDCLLYTSDAADDM
eukprot:3385324-Alexandrium_andersonii.AAC.1